MKISNHKAVIYSRFSSDMQREESIEAQIRACKYFAQKEGLEIVGTYTDRAKSGTTVKGRTDFIQMIEDSKNGDFNIVLVHKLNRFGRNGLNTLTYKDELERNGVALVSVTERLDDTPEGKLMLMVIAGMNEFYSANLKSEVLKGLKENAYNGKHTGGKPPLGYDVDKDTMKLVINTVEAESVKLIFSMYLDGNSYQEIIDALNERGFTTKLGEPFKSTSLHGILKNPKYTGVFTYSRSSSKDANGKRNGHKYKNDDEIIKVEGAVPVLINQEDFDKVQKKMGLRKQKAAKHRAKHTYLLSGKIICGECGAAYTGNCRVARPDHPEYISYRCNNRNKRPRCKGWEIRKETLESMVLNELANIVFNDSLIPNLAKGYSQYLMAQNKDGTAVVQAIKSQIAVIQKQMDNIVVVITNTASDALVAKLNELDSNKKGLVEKLRKAESQYRVRELTEEELLHSFNQARELLKVGKLSTVKALVERYVEKVIVSGEHIEVRFNLNVSSRVVTYPTTLSGKNKTPQTADQSNSVMFIPNQQSMLVTYGGEGETRTLAPVTRPTPLAGAPLHQLEYFSVW